jgi:ABC-type enterochelin transport system permease subunit
MAARYRVAMVPFALSGHVVIAVAVVGSVVLLWLVLRGEK